MKMGSVHYEILQWEKIICEVTYNPLTKPRFQYLVEHHIQGTEMNRNGKQGIEFTQLLKWRLSSDTLNENSYSA